MLKWQSLKKRPQLVKNRLQNQNQQHEKHKNPCRLFLCIQFVILYSQSEEVSHPEPPSSLPSGSGEVEIVYINAPLSCFRKKT